MQYALSDPRGPVRAAGRPYGGLLIGIEAAAIEMRARGLDVHVKVADAAAQARGPAAEEPSAPRGPAEQHSGALLGETPPGPEEAPVVPVPVAVAMSYAVREALANVASHAGTGEAWVEVSLGPADASTWAEGVSAVGGGTGADGQTRAGRAAAVGGDAGMTRPAGAVGRAGADRDTGATGDPAAPASLQVIVRDAGAGFDPARVDAARLGLRRSIVERIAEWGGRASIRSAPGEGTVVSLRWTASAQARGPAVAVGPADGWHGPW